MYSLWIWFTWARFRLNELSQPHHPEQASYESCSDISVRNFPVIFSDLCKSNVLWRPVSKASAWDQKSGLILWLFNICPLTGKIGIVITCLMLRRLPCLLHFFDACGKVSLHYYIHIHEWKFVQFSSGWMHTKYIDVCCCRRCIC